MEDFAASMVRLNVETRAYHAAADAGWRALMTVEVRAEQYVDQLVSVYGFEAPLEAALAYTPNLGLAIDVHERFHAGFIAQDLLALGIRPGEITRLPQCVLAPFASPLEALGWLYVAQRWTLLHDDVRRYISVHLPQAADACTYLSATAGHVSARWQDFGRRLERVTRSPRLLDEVIAGAHAAFRTWIGWSTRDFGLRRQG